MAEILCESDNMLPKINIRKCYSNTIEFGPNKELIKHIKYKLKNKELFMNTLKRKKKKKKCITKDKTSNTENQKNINFFLKSSNLIRVLYEDKNTDNIGFKTCFGNFFTDNKINKLIEPQTNRNKKSVDISIISKNKKIIIDANENSSNDNDQTKTIRYSSNKNVNKTFKEINTNSKKIIPQDKSINQLFNLSITPKVNEKNKSNLYLMKTNYQTLNSLSNDFPSSVREYGSKLKENKNNKY